MTTQFPRVKVTFTLGNCVVMAKIHDNEVRLEQLDYLKDFARFLRKGMYVFNLLSQQFIPTTAVLTPSWH